MRWKLTEHSRQIIAASEEMARSKDAEVVTAGHILCALLTDKAGNIAMAALVDSSGSEELRVFIKDAIHHLLSVDSGEVNIDALVGRAIRQAEAIDHSYAGPEHLLLALLEDSFSPAIAQCLDVMRVTKPQLRQKVFAILGMCDPESNLEA